HLPPLLIYSFIVRPPPRSILFPYTTLFRSGFAIQRLMNAMRQAHADGWFIVFDTLTLADDRLEAFYDNPNALRDYHKTPLIGRQPDRKSGSAGMPRPISYAVFCLKKKTNDTCPAAPV